ncbi:MULTISPECIES: sensor histidine kinase [Brevibacillus]|jgi:two-component system, OmpR family, sensor histidine kinase BaeS|uniref:histidine kinase n=2 Tax=Brevibacillus borstelensis TaxID=45462 RepID=M8D9N2_9BACL|nr:HAMP domain-containing sensor histidine kinase [Brevibacillus borstelensis]EMT50012.1 sensory transduction histidine kinase [Brevibacillus borstelensis AK1]MCC0567410.1 HAMP domain-containing histidine kinase [Brevibacillus borstelensis]MCM3472443.1 HAMP domain-containing histidine kinase [Brevibacillus borstelensis]MCM3560035.1 HAMP domain-containing histidine kinase [Brevibacillus borstelensis]MCM3591685.1 HAMP domain-containing histidine kinase [Brevibacillus borstelensis]
MKIRTKLFLTMSVMIVLLLLFLLGVTHAQFYISRDFAYLEDKAAFESLKKEFEQFYRDHGNSWEHVGDARFEYSAPFAGIVLSADGNFLYQQGKLSADELRNDGYKLVLASGDKRIGRLYVMNDSQFKTYEFKKMWYGILPNIGIASLLFTFVAALLTIFLLSWRLTSPIRKIIAGIEAIKKGDAAAIFPEQRKDEFGAIAKALREMNDSLAAAERTRKQLMSDVAHELKTPLMIIQGELELAHETGAPLSPAKQASLLDEVLRLSRLVHDVLDLSRLEAGMMELHPRTENLVVLLEDVTAKTRFMAEDKHIQLSVHAEEENIPVSVEKSRILQALYNILSNAIYYTNPGGQIRLHAETVHLPDRQQPYACIRVEDNGVGIPEADLPHIFNRFYRADHSRARPSGGTGLGLAIAQQNIVAHQGWIEVESEVGRGSVFKVYLPM